MLDFLKEAENIKQEIILIRRKIHEHPELGFEEKDTSKLIKEFLENEGIEYYSVAKTGVCAKIVGQKQSEKCIALRADMDALPIEEENNVPYSSKIKGKMHACGHDAHTAILLGVAKILNKNKENLCGTVKLFFEPAEETVGGATFMIEEGVLKNPNVDVVVALHVTEDIEKGKIKIKEGMVNAASNPFKVTIWGKGGHGAAPSVAIDPIIIASNIIQSIQFIISREVSSFNPAVITVGYINGGTAKNVIPDKVEFGGIIRTTTKENRKFVVERFKKVVNDISTSMRGRAEIEIEESYPCLYNDAQMTALVKDVAESIIGNDNIVIQPNPSMGVESFAYFANERPGVFYYLGTGNEVNGINKPAHSSKFNIDEDAIPIGVALQCGIVFAYLTR